MSFLKLSIPMLDGSGTYRPIIIESTAIESIMGREIKWHGLTIKGSEIIFKSRRETIDVAESPEQIWDMQFADRLPWSEMK